MIVIKPPPPYVTWLPTKDRIRVSFKYSSMILKCICCLNIALACIRNGENAKSHHKNTFNIFNLYL